MMSIVLASVESHIRNKLQLPEERFGVRFDGKPPPDCGDEYVSVYGLNFGPDQPDLNTGIDVDFTIGFTITRRTRVSPYTAAALQKEFMQLYTSMDFLLWKLIGWTHLNFDLLQTANNNLTTINASYQAFVEPFRFQTADPMPRPVTEAWFKPDASAAAAVTPSETYPYSGMIMEAVLSKFKRCLTLSALQTEAAIL